MNISSMGGGCIRLTFEVVKMQAIRYETINGKRVRRQKTFEKTINPFNKNADGSIKTREQVRADVRAEAKAWKDNLPHA